MARYIYHLLTGTKHPGWSAGGGMMDGGIDGLVVSVVVMVVWFLQQNA